MPSDYGRLDELGTLRSSTGRPTGLVRLPSGLVKPPVVLMRLHGRSGSLAGERRARSSPSEQNQP